MDDCLKCKDYRKCSGNRVWYHYGEIRWCVHQVLWIIERSETLRLGNWPLNPDGSSYTDPNIRTGYKSEAYYTKPAVILGEVEYRLDRTGKDGKLLWDEVKGGLDLRPEAESALMYVKGWRRERLSYLNWQKQRDYRGKDEALLSR